jgi:hypothetical protein
VEGTEVTGEAVNEQGRDVQTQHIEGIGIAQLLVQACPFAGEEDIQSEDQGGNGCTDVKSGSEVIFHE